jgi:hypothetical protein
LQLKQTSNGLSSLLGEHTIVKRKHQIRLLDDISARVQGRATSGKFAVPGVRKPRSFSQPGLSAQAVHFVCFVQFGMTAQDC